MRRNYRGNIAREINMCLGGTSTGAFATRYGIVIGESV